MDPVLSGSLCFLVLAIVMYVKFIREHPWGDDDDDGASHHHDRHKTSPIEPDTVPFLHPSSPVGVPLQKHHHSIKPQQQSRPSPHHGLAVLQKAHQYKNQHGGGGGGSSSATVGVAGVAGGGSAHYPPYMQKKQPMRRRAHSGATNNPSVQAGGNSTTTTTTTTTTTEPDVVGAKEQLPSTIFETTEYHHHHQQQQQERYPPSSGRNQHRINFNNIDDFDHEMGFLSPTRQSGDAVNDSLESVPFEANEDDAFYDLENRMSFNEAGDDQDQSTLAFVIPPPPVHQHNENAIGVDGRNRRNSTDVLPTPTKLDGMKAIERQFVRDVAPPAQMQLEVARKARIPLFLHSPMYVKTSAAPLVDDVGINDDAAAQVPMEGEGAQRARRKGKLPPNVKNKSLHIDFNELKVAEMIGQGAFGTVHRATWRGTSVAVKILVCQYLTVDILEEFETEVQIMSILRHPNICLLMGACLEPPTRCLVIEYLPRGSLWNVLRQDVVIDLNKQLIFARDTALGMNYLHSFQPPILHRDLKSPNLLVDTSFAIKISDFGLARVRAHFQTMTGNCGTTQWMAPEVLAAEKYTEKADVFSFGVVVWETITRQCPYEGLSQIQAALGVLNNNLRPTIPAHCPPLFKKLMTLCWVNSPEDRPTFETILELLHSSNDGMLPQEEESQLDALTRR